VPRASNITAHSGGGAIQLTSVNGRVALRTAFGSVAVTQLIGEIRVRSGYGSIRIDKSIGSLDLETERGRIAVNGKPSVLRAKTGLGAVTADIDDATVMTDDWELTTGAGGMTVTLPAAFNAELHAETSSGAVRSSHSRAPDSRADGWRGGRSPERRGRQVLRTRMGHGGKTLRVQNGKGSVRIES
jgi:DUF4097 and DUF4098 domain-containing protein YvlB